MSTLTLNTEATAEVDLDNLAAEALADDMAAKQATERAKKSKDILKAALEAQGLLNPDFKGTDLVRCIVKAPMTFDPKKAKELLNDDEIAQCSALSGTLVKANVAPNVYSLMTSPGTVSLTLGVQS